MSQKATEPQDRAPEKGGISRETSTTGQRLPWLREPRVRWFAGIAALLILGFGSPLVELFRYAINTDLHSHIVLIPFVSAYLIFLRRGDLPRDFRASPSQAGVCVALGLSCLGFRFANGLEVLGRNDALGLTMAAFLCLLLAGGFLTLGAPWLKEVAFPVAFLVFLIPLPDGAVEVIEHGLVLASAEATNVLFGLAGLTYYRTGPVFELPGITLEVASECSGIRSSWVLFITSTLAAHLVLKSTWRRVFIVAAVIPLGIVRNGFRILVIAYLCVHRGPHMIDSPVHRSGGPYFFALSLIPLFVLLWWLRRGEREADGDA